MIDPYAALENVNEEPGKSRQMNPGFLTISVLQDLKLNVHCPVGGNR